MANRTANNGNSVSGKVRFIMLDAEITGANLGDIVQAIAGAVRPAPVMQRVLTAPAAILEDKKQVAEADQLSFDLPESNGEEVSTIASKPNVTTQKRTSESRKYPEPKVIDIDLDAGPVSWEQFAKQKSPKETTKKYLVVAAWFKEHRSTGSVTQDHVYTCFRKVGWPTNIKDMGAPFRELKKSDWVASSKPGTFEINHLGLDQVRKMGGGN